MNSSCLLGLSIDLAVYEVGDCNSTRNGYEWCNRLVCDFSDMAEYACYILISGMETSLVHHMFYLHAYVFGLVAEGDQEPSSLHVHTVITARKGDILLILTK